jgi:hypothetical protein
MIRDVLTGIKSLHTTWKTANPTKALAVAGGLFFVRAPQGTDGDYVTFQKLLGGSPDNDMSSKAETIPIRFDVWVEDQSGRYDEALALEIAEQITDVYDNATVPVVSGETTTGYCYQCERQNSPECVPDPDGGWHSWVDYILKVQEA